MLKEDAEEMQKRIMEAKFDFNDFLKQTRSLARMGSMGGLMKLIPGMNKVFFSWTLYRRSYTFFVDVALFLLFSEGLFIIFLHISFVESASTGAWLVIT